MFFFAIIALCFRTIQQILLFLHFQSNNKVGVLNPMMVLHTSGTYSIFFSEIIENILIS